MMLSFGSTDSTTGEWKINTTPSVTYGTNGFLYLKMEPWSSRSIRSIKQLYSWWWFT